MPKQQTASKKIIIGNWKTAPATPDEAIAIFSTISESLQAKFPKNTDVIICPPSLYLSYLINPTGKKQKIKMGVQNIYAGEKAMCTGEISAEMAQQAGARYVIVGHSERRGWETDDMLASKMDAAIAAKLIPILCIGEEERDEDGRYLQVIADQISKRLTGVTKKDMESIIIAYEPIWAIGADAAMRAEDVHQMTIFIKKTLMNIYKLKGLPDVPVLYGGSVDPTNARGIMVEGKANGLLIGRQSLVPENFLDIILNI